MARVVRDVLLGYLATFGCSREIDEAVLEYACGVMQSMIEDDGEDDDESLIHLDALLAGACGQPYEQYSEAERQEQLATIVQEPQNAGALASHIRAIALSPGNERNADRRGENMPLVDEPTGTGQAAAVVKELEALCSGAVSTEFLDYALECKFHFNAEALAAWLLDSDRTELQRTEAQWEEQRRKGLQDDEAARLLKERNKQLILQKFDLRPVAQPTDPKKGGKGGLPLELWTAKQDQQAQKPKVRYLDGRVVSTKGEKFIIEKTSEEWDGGSRGKVYTKGKRGKGFI
ncbi:hypothetical protein VOLCADRAFT_88352 [Volvox carteri f. nagariensis]|uniref:Uncharacterized protein n=1 Tax=Volvox carteri f. nagariensis TaxID=3068 RepID=D8TN50_VOLCA|nr:uncharacterized protein VOLCADRAFT_88352 [Volvox carteri f. nagariensis]EFJ50928.1 hypothetical protein VOLCADRAFT_88352 [Volvox carteri f. nagariensis]|eukprot:XP_002947940.1 hypothetical protein VOLCADRAFT_88352 [Volvox carteri f. nagariensis]